ncbi:response regulator transcription factor [Enterococcus sp. HY326]|uniref:response regulator transcription factor n=1 Tax=Enterococcus sp. HY326 TaxID=2971265 RepID=UPI0022400AC3|nr:response regulator transcription factor [Enterococcus sp. HY326]
MIQIVVVDDDYLVTTSLKTIVEAEGKIQVVASGHSGQEAEALYQKWQPDVLLLDIRMAEGSGIQAAENILTANPQAKILLLTTFSDEEYIQKALEIGVKGYLIKQDLSAIVPAILAVVNQQVVFGSQIVEKLPSILKPAAAKPDFSLSEQEETILIQVANGLNNKEIAAALFLSEGTVRNYISRLLDKLNLRDRTQLAVFYYREYSK